MGRIVGMRRIVWAVVLMATCGMGQCDEAFRPAAAAADGEVEKAALEILDEGLLFDGHNDLPWEVRAKAAGDFGRYDIRQRLPFGQTDIPRLREGKVKAQFWSVYVPSAQPHPAKAVLEQIDLVHRMEERYPEALELATTAEEVERIAGSGKIACLIGVEGGVALEESLAMLRTLHRLGARYMTLTHNDTLPWVDAATDAPRSDGLSDFGKRVVREMNRLGMLVDISHVSPATMGDVLALSEAPVIASHSNAFSICPHLRNVPDEILARLKENRGVVMVNFYTTFVNPEAAAKVSKAREELRAAHGGDEKSEAYRRALGAWYRENSLPRPTVGQVVDHIDHIVKTAGIDHVGIGSDFDGIDSTPVGLDDVSTYPKLVEELLRRGYAREDIQKILGKNILRALREAAEVAKRLRGERPPELDESLFVPGAH